MHDHQRRPLPPYNVNDGQARPQCTAMLGTPERGAWNVLTLPDWMQSGFFFFFQTKVNTNTAATNIFRKTLPFSLHKTSQQHTNPLFSFNQSNKFHKAAKIKCSSSASHHHCHPAATSALEAAIVPEASPNIEVKLETNEWPQWTWSIPGHHLLAFPTCAAGGAMLTHP